MTQLLRDRTMALNCLLPFILIFAILQQDLMAQSLPPIVIGKADSNNILVWTIAFCANNVA